MPGGQRSIVREQALDAAPDVVEPAGGIQPGCHDKPEVAAGGFIRVPARDLEQGADSRAAVSPLYPGDPLGNQGPVHVIQWHDIRHGAECHQIQIPGKVGSRHAVPAKVAPLPHARTQGHEKIEHDPDSGDLSGWKRAARLVRVDDGRGRREELPGQMVIGHNDVDTPVIQYPYALNAGNAIVHSDDQRRRHGDSDPGDFRRKPITVVEAVRHQVIHPRGTQ